MIEAEYIFLCLLHMYISSPVDCLIVCPFFFLEERVFERALSSIKISTAQQLIISLLMGLRKEGRGGVCWGLRQALKTWGWSGA